MTLSRIAARAWNVCDVLELEATARPRSVPGAIGPGSARQRRADVAGHGGGTPPRANIAPGSAVVVVLPFVPVTPTIGFLPSSRRRPARPRSRSGVRAAAAPRAGSPMGHPGSSTSTSTPVRIASSSLPNRVSTPSSATPFERQCGRQDDGRPRAGAAPRRPRGPTAPGRRRAGAPHAELDVVQVVETKPPRRSRGEDPEAHDDLRVGPRLHLEVVVDRGHQEGAPPEVLERDDLDDHAERLDREIPPIRNQQELGLRDDREEPQARRQAPSNRCRP